MIDIPVLTPLVQPLDSEWPILWQLTQRLHQLGFEEGQASQALGSGHLSLREPHLWPHYLHQCRKSGIVGMLTGFFLLEDWVPKSQLEEVLGSSTVGLLKKLRWTRNFEDRIGMRYFLYPICGSYILTDAPVDEAVSTDQVYYLGSDSYLLSWLTPRVKMARSLDHCTGSGVHPVLANRHATQSWGLDINRRALQFAQFNARLNHKEGAGFLYSDCYQNVADGCGAQDFELITANPPFVPAPQALAKCRGNGTNGEDVTEAIIKGLSQHLSQHGLFSMITNIPVLKGSSFFERCRDWLGDWGERCSIICLHCHQWTPLDYAVKHLSASGQLTPQNLTQWLEHYQQIGLESITYSQVFVMAHPPETPANARAAFPDARAALPHARAASIFEFERYFVPPWQERWDFMQTWLTSLRSAAEKPQDCHWEMNPGLDSIEWVEGRQAAYITWKPEHFWWQPQPLRLNAAQTECLEQLSQKIPISDPTALRQLLQEGIVLAQTPLT